MGLSVEVWWVGRLAVSELGGGCGLRGMVDG